MSTDTGVVDPAALARSIIAANSYLTLATADEAGLPWASPVWFASVDLREFFWVSSPEARHSRNIAARPEVAVVIFDSGQRIGTGRGVYLSARAEAVPEPDLDRGIGTFSMVSQAQGARAWGRTDIQAPARLRLYRATVVASYVLSDTDERVPVDLA
jgi:nitroimidazol reductase NimA-like FMN-containing flavoprotein (pyridoxamine 5'-phosphate oxidase superfamily)